MVPFRLPVRLPRRPWLTNAQAERVVSAVVAGIILFVVFIVFGAFV